MRIRELAEVRVSYGYRRIHVLLLREGWKVNPSTSSGHRHKRVYRLYRQGRADDAVEEPRRRHVSGCWPSAKMGHISGLN
jgi:putative transposase